MEATTLTCEDRSKISSLIETNSVDDIRQILEKYTLPLEDMVGIIKFIMKTSSAHNAYGKIEIIKMLHNDFGLDIAGNSSMFVKLVKNYPHEFMIELLIDLGIDVNVDDGKLLMISCRYKFVDNVKLLLDLGVNPNIRDGKALIKTLIKAERWLSGTSENIVHAIVELLFQYGFSQIHKDALVICVSKGYSDIAKFLLEAGVDVNAEHGAALIRATSDKKYKLIELLLNYGADINCFNDEKNQQKYSNDLYEKYVAVHDLLVDQGVDPIIVMKFSMFAHYSFERH